MSLFLMFFALLTPVPLSTEGASLKMPRAPEPLSSFAEAVVEKITGKKKQEEETEEKVEQEEELPVIDPEEEIRIHSLESLEKLEVDHEKTIPFAMVGTFRGHFRTYGTTIRNGVVAAFRRINKEGGIHEKHLRLICVDDHGKPERTHRIITMLRKKHKVTVCIGNMGSRNSAHILPLVERKKLVMLFPWSGIENLNSPHLHNVVNGLGNIEPQIDRLITYCREELMMKKIAVFSSDGTFYTRAKNMTIDLLKQRGLRPVAQAAYNRLTMDINTPAQKIIDADPKIVICLGSSYPTAKLISRFFELGHYGTTFIGIDSTMFVPDILRAKGAAFSYSSTVPNPAKSVTAIAKSYRDDMQESFPNDVVNILSFSYYIHATLITKALQSLTDANTFATQIVSAIEDMRNVDLGGFRVSFDKSTRFAYQPEISIIKG